MCIRDRVNPDVRLAQHLKDKKATSKAAWIRELACLGLKPSMLILEEIDGCTWQEAEKKWISDARDDGWKLTNLTHGGDGGAILRERMDAYLREGAVGFDIPQDLLNRLLALGDDDKIEAIVAMSRACLSHLRFYTDSLTASIVGSPLPGLEGHRKEDQNRDVQQAAQMFLDERESTYGYK